MEELYRKVMRGIYPKIPSKYTEDLSDAIKLMIQVEPGARPTCEELLKMPMIYKRIEFFNETKSFDLDEEKNENLNKQLQLLKTITVPNRFENLSKNLPKPNYNTDQSNQSFHNGNINKYIQYGGLTISNELLPNIKKDKVPNIYKNNWKKSQSIRKEDSKEHQNIINNSNGSIRIQERGYEINGKVPKSITKNKKYNNKSENKKINIT